MYDTNERRRVIEQQLRNAAEPITGNQMSALYGVSRQVIVQDIAVLRAGGLPVEASARGYLLKREEGSCACVVACRHSGMDELRQELYAVVDAGACVSDIIVEHPVYGDIVGKLFVNSRETADQLVEKLSQPKATPLSVVTGGMHLHTLTATDQKTLEAATAALGKGGFLVELAE